MRRTLFVVLLLAALVPAAGQSATAQITPLGQYSGYSTGTAVHFDAIQNGTTRLEDTEVAFSGANVNSSGLGAALTNELAQAYQQATTAADMAAGRGSGLEIGLATTVPNITNANQINLGSTVQAFAPQSTGLLTENFLNVNLDPVINSEYLRGQAQAIYNEKVCVLGQPISSGLGFAGTAAAVGTPSNVLAVTNTGDNAINQSKSFNYLIPNADGTYGLVTETRQILAPLTLFPGTAALGGLEIPGVEGIGVITVEFAGEWVLRSTSTGKAGGSMVEYAVEGVGPETKVITVKMGDQELGSLTTQDILGEEGLVIQLPAELGIISIGAPPRAIGSFLSPTPPEILANGTKAAAAVDVVQVTGRLAELGLADLRIGHMESMTMVPVGGIQCGIPVMKTGNPTSVVAGKGEVVNYTITIPADVEAFKAIACDVMNIKVVDVITAEPGVLFTVESADRGGVISGNTVTWENLGTYKPGDQPIVLNVKMTVPSNSAAGKITDVATASAVLGNCQGNASANAGSLTGLAKMEAAALVGSDAFAGRASTATEAAPLAVLPAVLPAAEQGPTPIGGVQTGAGGTSPLDSQVLPISAALGSLALLGSLTAWLRRKNG